MKLSINNTSPKCLNGHTWNYASNLFYNLEGLACDCGEVIYTNNETRNN